MQDVDFDAEAGGSGPPGAGGPRGAGRQGRLGGGGRLGRRRVVVVAEGQGVLGLLLLAAQELAVAQALPLLVGPKRVGTGQEALSGQARAVLQELLCVDDDLALAAQIGRQHLLDRRVQPLADRLRRRGPAQDQAGAGRGLGRGGAVVGSHQLSHQVTALLEAQAGEIQRGGENAPPSRPLAIQDERPLAELDFLAVALGEGEVEAGLGGHAVVVSHFERHRPALLSRRHQGQALGGAQHLHLRRRVGDGVQPVQRRGRAAAARHDSVEQGAVQSEARAPVLSGGLELQGLALDHREFGAFGLGGEAQGPFQPRALRDLAVEAGQVAGGQAGIGGGDHAEPLPDQVGNPRRRGRALMGGSEDACARPQKNDHHRQRRQGPGDGDTAQRPGGTRVGGARRHPTLEPVILQALKRGQAGAVADKKVAAVLKLGAHPVQAPHGPGPIKAAAAHQRRDAQDRHAEDKDAERSGDASPSPRRCSGQHHPRDAGQDVVQSAALARLLGPAVDQGDAHGLWARCRLVASQRSSANNAMATKARRGVTSCVAGLPTRAPTRG